ncbi:hypothetical protein BD408DRAFT_427679 [Parasitella parasitica]|nr:hypothetical protein BD408DRAFT_427679 [Parasitella parasitica]
MVSRLLLLVTFIAVSLMGDKMVRGVPVNNTEDNYAVGALNVALAICKPPEGYTLCRVKRIFFSCTTSNQFDAIPKERCEAESKKDFTFKGAGGSKDLFKSSEAFLLYQRNEFLCGYHLCVGAGESAKRRALGLLAEMIIE